ncbi:flavodoxin family protein [Vibrio parahaemolyticus]|uniref:flavodoxin family protein n=1 Tax=Vibrio parahaemolyticus TaxID=670 RepID=UPI00044FFB61|nr:NAD(P)H-dependent oxidoreductase [Vibrio parahaemolyticus]EHH2514752.1 NAD(P)H-dependent oxidoreductase [Vibrio parahaemolyticus]ELA9297986.1 NAD(P)H-dependent oxidoreductase [Vibrio parahaemolyticus]ELB2255033.1 NAD(P)H-dependent oxidoreductase [Vibrio parahaemolyticus]EXJ24577.1 NADPH-dependent FMN reductase family protein [Vibrio parahaemolyticus VPTS-2009]MBE4053487.1 NAD(P)H-dependent oxidoreductase [Vibrio parahaemolyticus]
MNIAVILGTSKSDGNTRNLVESFVDLSGAKLFDLSEFDISFYDYEHENRSDDFLPIVHELVGFDHIVFASPVYWYSMSAQLKVFFDRLSDLLTIEKELGRKLKGKSISVLSTGYNLKLPDCFVEPFELTAKYMQLEFKGCEYLAIQTESDLGKASDSAVQALENVT